VSDVKSLLGSLLCLVLATSHTYAVKGGPGYGGGNVRTTGTYAGVLYPIGANNSIGLFSVQIPRTGLGTGTAFLFANSNAYNGTMQGTADPDSAQFTGFIDVGFLFSRRTRTGGTDAQPIFTIETLRAVGAGRVDGQIRNSGPRSRTVGRLVGTSLIEFNPVIEEPQLNYELIGFKQADL
jgi:hypothetical protein